jgi:hypothetical protein
MEGGSRPEDISLLDTKGGAEPSLIAVQGGGGSSSGDVPWEGYNIDKSVLAAGASNNIPIQAVEGGGATEGGGLLDWLAGTPAEPEFTFNPSASLEDTFNGVWTKGLTAQDKFAILSKTTMDVAKVPADRLSNEEVIPTFLIQNTADMIDAKYGKGFDITNNAVNESFYGKTEQQQQAGREAYINAKAAGKSDEEAFEAVTNAMKTAQTGDPSRDIPLQLKLSRPIVPEKAQKTYRKYENRAAYRREYKINTEVPIEDDHPMVIWMKSAANISAQEGRYKKYVKQYINHQETIRNRAKAMSGTNDGSIKTTGWNNGYTFDPVTIRPYVACLDSSIEHVVVIPDFGYLLRVLQPDSTSRLEIFQRICIELYELNILSIDGDNCKINKKVALIFTGLYGLRDDDDRQLWTDNYYNIFPIASKLELQNSANIFVLSYNNFIFGINLISTLFRSQPANISIPTLLSPSHILFPYRLKNGLNGIIISDILEPDGTPNPGQKNVFNNTIYKNTNYGRAGFGFFVEYGYNFTEANNTLIRYNVCTSSIFVNKHMLFPLFGEEEIDNLSSIKPDGKTLSTLDFDGPYTENRLDEFPKHTGNKYIDDKLNKEIVAILAVLGISYNDFVNKISSGPRGYKIYNGRNFFIVKNELYLTVYNKRRELLGNNLDAKKADLDKLFKRNIDYISYLRFPLTEEYKRYIKLFTTVAEGAPKPLQDIYDILGYRSAPLAGGGKRKKTPTKRKLFIGGGRLCGDSLIQTRNLELGKFDTEQIAPFTIFILSLDKESGAEAKNSRGTCQIKDDTKSQLAIFTEWPRPSEIANSADLEIIEVGNKTYAIRNGTKNVKFNWMGYVASQAQEGGNYEKEYNKIMNEITTTLGGTTQETIQAQSFVGGAIQDCSYATTVSQLMSCMNVSSISTITDVPRPYNMYTTKELNNTGGVPNWIPPVAAVASAGLIAGVVGLASLGKTQTLEPNTPVIQDAGESQLPTGYQHNVPILSEGEAELLNDLNLTPSNMSEIFKSDNIYAKNFNINELKSWGTAISMFLENLTTESCYNNRLLLTRSECEKSKCFLYSIRDYLDDPMISGQIQTGMLMKDGTSELNEPDIENDSEIVLAHDNMPTGEYLIHPDDNKPYVNVGVIEKRTNLRKHFNLKLGEKSENVGQKHPTADEIEKLQAKFKETQLKYAGKYVMYLY